MDYHDRQHHGEPKPSCPYLPGFTVDITPHVPPPPFGATGYPRTTRDRPETSWAESVSRLEAILAFPPLATEPPPGPLFQARITITKSISIGNARGAQLVECSLRSKNQEGPLGSLPQRVVAKIFDSLYYNCVNGYSGALIDTAFRADQDYSREAAAYDYLHTRGLTGSFAPQYYGSWTLTLPVSFTGKGGQFRATQREVRLVLIEHLEGTTLQNLFTRNQPLSVDSDGDERDASHLPEEYRLEVLAQICDGIVRQHRVGLGQCDWAARNVIVVPDPHRATLPAGPAGTAAPRPRAVLIDYNISTIRAHTKRGHVGIVHDLPPNPAKLFWNESYPELRGWIPEWWYANKKQRRQWLLDTFASDDAAPNYEPLEDKLDASVDSSDEYDQED